MVYVNVNSSLLCKTAPVADKTIEVKLNVYPTSLSIDVQWAKAQAFAKET